MFANIKSATLKGLDALLVDVEIDLSKGLPGWQIVGLPETMIKESKERVAAAIRNSGLEIASRKTTVNLAPADIKKHGTAFDLPIATGLLIAAGVFSPARAAGWLIAGELGLSGNLSAIPGVLSFATTAKEQGLKGLIIPADNMGEAGLVEGLDIVPAKDLGEVVNFLKEGIKPPVPEQVSQPTDDGKQLPDLSEIKGQVTAKRALEISAAGGHHLLLYGPPGTGKTMLAERLPQILPQLSYNESIETTKIYSLFGLIDRKRPLIKNCPMRSPHHSASYVGLVGGGAGIPKPGEISLAHNGVLFMDEIAEFRKDVLECLRQPLETGRMHISRSGVSLTYPARFMLVAAMNPCRCGFFGHPTKACICSIGQIQSYRRKISGPLLDRIDLHVSVPPIPAEQLHSNAPSEDSKTVHLRVLNAREIQAQRLAKFKLSTNSQLTPRLIKEFCKLTTEGSSFLSSIIDKMSLSARAYDRILRVSRTIADLAGAKEIAQNHIMEAAQFRGFDKTIW